MIQSINNKHLQSEQLHIPCPSCPSSDAYCLYADGHGHRFSCGYHHGPNKGLFDLNDYTYEYIGLRGISKESLRVYDIKSKVDHNGKPVALGFRYPFGGTKVRTLDTKHFYWEGTHRPGLFGLDKFAAGSHKYVTITEGELDAASLYQSIRGPVVSVQSSGSAAADCSADRVWLSSFERIYLAFDGDAAGRDATANVDRLFDYNKVFHVRFSRPDRKDANSYVEAGEADELVQIWHNAKKYLPDTVVSSPED